MGIKEQHLKSWNYFQMLLEWSCGNFSKMRKRILPLLLQSLALTVAMS